MKSRLRRWRMLVAGTAMLGICGTATWAVAGGSEASASMPTANRIFAITSHASTTTPIKHVVVIFQENVSFDHYFATYPKAANTDGEPFYAPQNTPSVNGLTPSLLSANPNGINPQRLPYTVPGLLTCDQNHNYMPEQFAFDNGKMDRFAISGGTATVTGNSPEGQPCKASDTMNYYDGNDATDMWNYASHFAMNDNSFGTVFGPSAPGAISLVSGVTSGVVTADAVRNSLTDGDTVSDGNGGYSLISDAQPYFDDCTTRDAVALSGQNIGDQLNAHGLSWGWFQGGFTPNAVYTGAIDSVSTYNQLNEPGRATCTTAHNVGAALGGTGTNYGTKGDYIAHHEPFQYYTSTANPHHLQPTSLSVVGADTSSAGQFNTANHQYDLSWFNNLVAGIKNGAVPASHFPAVTILKAPGYQDGHQAYSDPVDEENFVVDEINSIESLPTWNSTAIFIAYDDSDGFYDHVYPGVANPSATTQDVLNGPGLCGAAGATPLGGAMGRCGYGPRQPLIVISPYAKPNYVSSVKTDQTSITAFIEQNWKLGSIAGSFANIAGSVDDMFNFKATADQLTPPLYLNAATGEPTAPVIGTISPKSGSIHGGTKVTIDGMGFALAKGRTSFYFGDVRAKGVSCHASTTMLAPATTCTVTAPPGMTAGPVVVSATVGHKKAIDDATSFTYKG